MIVIFGKKIEAMLIFIFFNLMVLRLFISILEKLKGGGTHFYE